MRDLDVTSIDDSDARTLLGADFPQLHLYRDIKIGKDHEPIAIRSTLRWVLLSGKDNNKNTISNNSFQSFTSPLLDQIVENFWELNRTKRSTKKLQPLFQRKNREQFRL